MLNYDKYKPTEEDVKIGIDNFFTQLLVEVNKENTNINSSLKELASERPTIIYVVGQPGSGKTTLSKYKKAQYNERNEAVVEVGADKIATYHKYYEEIVRLFTPDVGYMLTRQFVKVASPIIYKSLRENKLNIIRESSLSKGESDYAKIKDFKDKGYQVEIDVVAVDKFESFLCCIERKIELLSIDEDSQHGVSRENHDRMYEPIVHELEEIEKRGISTRINVYTRSDNPGQFELAWTSEGEDKRYSNAQEAIIYERMKSRKRIFQEPQQYLGRIEEVRRKIHLKVQDTKMKQNFLGQLEQLEGEFLNELTSYRNDSQDTNR